MIIKLFSHEIHHELGFVVVQCKFSTSTCAALLQTTHLRYPIVSNGIVHILGQFSLCDFVPTEAGSTVDTE